jgi:phosphoglycolate phosphatase
MQAIIFDFDGVLAETFKFTLNITKDVGHEVNEKSWKDHHNGNVFEKPSVNFTEESMKDFFAQYYQKAEEIKSNFSEKNIKELSEIAPLFVISSGQEKSIIKFLKHNNLDYFTEVLGVDFHRSKEKKFKYLFDKYNYQAENVIFISDTLGDVLEAKKVNVKTIAVDFGFHDREQLKKGKPFKIASSVDEVIKLIKKQRLIISRFR